MKQKLLFALMLLCMSLCSSNVWAEQEEPVAVSLQDGARFYLYNVEAKLYLNRGNSWGTEASLMDKGLPIEAVHVTDDIYQFKFMDRHEYLFCHNPSETYTDYNDQGIEYTYWNVEQLDNGHIKLQIAEGASNYGKDKYLGWDRGNNTKVGLFVNSADEWILTGKQGEDKFPHIVVNLLEPGSLGTELLYNVDNIRDVKWLKVYGNMNADDWAKIKMMKDSLQWLDLSEAKTDHTYTKLEDGFFKRQGDNDNNWQYLRYVHFPKGLTEIGASAFERSVVDSVSIPDVEKMGTGVFDRASNLRVVRLSDKISEIPFYAFWNCTSLVSVFDAHNLKTIGSGTFFGCRNLRDIDLSNVESLDYNAFAGNSNLDPGDLTHLKKVLGPDALMDTRLKSIKLNSIEWLDGKAFNSCRQLEEVEFPANFTNFNDYMKNNVLFWYCTSLRKLKFNASCVVTGDREWMLDNSIIKDSITIYVPKYLVNYYKQDSYWYQFKIEGFDVEDPENYTIDIRSNMVMNNRERFEGSPNIFLRNHAYLKINGENPQTLKNVDYDYNTQIFSNCENITIDGYLCNWFSHNAKQWYYLSLPFDCVISKTIGFDTAKQFAFRYYDGAGRAENGAYGNWKNYDINDTIPAGTGFIVQVNVSGWCPFYSADNDSKQYIFSPREFVKTLEVNESEVAANRGWNLIGNPYQTYYNNHMLNFTGPITVWNGSGYAAYSLTDDDYAIRPNEAFFVQCPNEEYNTIGFPTQGRQLTPVIESQNAAKEWNPKPRNRQIINLCISNGEMEDQTRVVLNEEASMSYETTCDASKFWSMDSSVPQLYTLDAVGTQYAINERPMGEGSVKLGFYAGEAGKYTISVKRCDAEQVFINDCLTGKTEEITNSEYTFNAEAGTYESRFTLTFISNDATGIKTLEMAEENARTEVFSTDGKFLGTDASGLGAGVYVIRQGNKVNKVVIR